MSLYDDAQHPIEKARKSFTGQRLTNAQFAETMAVTDIMLRTIAKSGSFKEKLGDYAHAFARSEKFDAIKGEGIIRDIFKARFGQTMNQMREGLIAREETAKLENSEAALQAARKIEELIKEGDTMPFYRAFDQAAGELSIALGVTENGAKAMMKEAYHTVEKRDLYETGKALEAQYRPPEQVFQKDNEARAKAYIQTHDRQR